MTDWHPETDRLVALALADVDPGEQEQLVSHLAGCPACRDEYTGLSDGLQQALAAAPAVAPPPGFSGRVLAAMTPPAAIPRVRPQRERRLVAAAVLLGLLAGVGGTLAVTSWSTRPPATATTQAPVATQLLTSAGLPVGSAGITVQGGRTYLLLNITAGRPGASYECFLVGRDGHRSSGGRWTLTSEYGSDRASGAWLVPVSGDPPATVELVAPSGKVWSSANF